MEIEWGKLYEIIDQRDLEQAHIICQSGLCTIASRLQRYYPYENSNGSGALAFPNVSSAAGKHVHPNPYRNQPQR